MGHHFFLFPQLTFLFGQCPNGSSYKEAFGVFTKVCTLPEKLHEGFVSNISTHIYPLDIFNHVNKGTQWYSSQRSGIRT